MQYLTLQKKPRQQNEGHVTNFALVQSLMLAIAKGLLEEEAKEQVEWRKRYMEETCPPLSLPRTMQELQVPHTNTPPHSTPIWL